MQFTPTDPLPLSFRERIDQAMGNSWSRFVRSAQNSIVNFIWELPFLIMNLLRLAFWVIVFLLVRFFIRKRKGRKRGERTFEWLPTGRSAKASAVKKDEAPEESEKPGDEK